MSLWKIRLERYFVRLLPKKMRSKFFVVIILISLPPLFVLGFLSYQNAMSSLSSYLGKTDNAGLYEHDNKIQEIERSSWYRQAYAAQGRVTFFRYNVLGDYSNSLSTVKLFSGMTASAVKG